MIRYRKCGIYIPHFIWNIIQPLKKREIDSGGRFIFFYLEPQEYGKDPTECVLTLSHSQEAYFQDNTIECGSWIH